MSSSITPIIYIKKLIQINSQGEKIIHYNLQTNNLTQTLNQDKKKSTSDKLQDSHNKFIVKIDQDFEAKFKIVGSI